MKVLSLFVLVFQNTGLVLAMRWSRLAKGDLYKSTTAVVMCEVFKFVACLGYLAVSEGLQAPPRTLYNELVCKPMEVLRVSVPAFLYTMQSNLLFVALSNMDPAFFQVAYQLKILTTAVFSVTMLGRHVSFGQWLSLGLLTCGIGLVALSQVESGGGTSAADLEAAKHRNTALGLSIVIVLCISSGFAGVYFEKVLKQSGGAGLVVRNLQLGSVSLVLASSVAYFKNGEEIARDGFFLGYTKWVWTTISLQAIGGLVVAVVMRFGDNILKNFALAFSILLSYGASMRLFGVPLSVHFCIGALLVIIATFCYGHAARPEHDSAAAQHHKRLSMLVPGATGTGESIGATGSSTSVENSGKLQMSKLLPTTQTQTVPT